MLSNFPILFISVKNNLRVREVIKESKKIYYERQRIIKTSDLNNFLEREKIQGDYWYSFSFELYLIYLLTNIALFSIYFGSLIME